MRKHSGAASSLSLHLRHHLRQLRREGSGHVQLWHRLRDLRCLRHHLRMLRDANPAPCGVCATTSAATRATSAARMVSATTTPCHACMCSLTNAGPSKGVAHDTSRGDLHHAISLYTRTCGYNRTLALGSSAGGLGGGGGVCLEAYAYITRTHCSTPSQSQGAAVDDAVGGFFDIASQAGTRHICNLHI